MKIKYSKINKFMKKNEICICGNNSKKKPKKFIDCCYKKNLNLKDYLNHVEEGMKQNKYNLYGKTCILDKYWKPCSSNAIKSHTISKSLNILSHIGPKPLKIRRKDNSKKNKPVFEEFTADRASTFAGFCIDHDHMYNNNIDVFFDINEYKSYLAAAHRQYFYEISQHKSFIDLSIKIKSLIDLSNKNVLKYIDKYYEIRKVSENDLQYIINNMKNELIIEKDDITIVNNTLFKCIGIEFENKLPFSFSGTHNPYYDLTGESLNIDVKDLSKPLPSIFISLVNNKKTATLIFVFLKEFDMLNKFINSILNSNNLTDKLFKISFLLGNSIYKNDFIYGNENKTIYEEIFLEDDKYYKKDDYLGRLNAINKIPKLNIVNKIINKHNWSEKKMSEEYFKQLNKTIMFIISDLIIKENIKEYGLHDKEIQLDFLKLLEKKSLDSNDSELFKDALIRLIEEGLLSCDKNKVSDRTTTVIHNFNNTPKKLFSKYSIKDPRINFNLLISYYEDELNYKKVIIETLKKINPLNMNKETIKEVIDSPDRVNLIIDKFK